jgi:hypothetical protein
MNVISDLSRMYSDYKIYPACTFYKGTPLRVFQEMFSDNYYSNDMNTFLQEHDYKPVRRGADLPWWGEYYFKDNSHKKALIISQDSLSADSGSVAFYAHIMQAVNNEAKFRNFYDELAEEYRRFGYSNWNKIKEMIKDWEIGFENIFITDASKVYLENSSDKFDLKKSRELLKKEIEFCKPDILILLGSKPLNLLAKEYVYATIVDKAELIKIEGINTVVCPFPVGNGRSQKNFNQRMDRSRQLIKDVLSAI